MKLELEEYNEELGLLKENLNACTMNRKLLEKEVQIVGIELQMKPNNSELLRLKVQVLDRYNLNEEMIRILKLAIRVLKNEKETSEVYEAYITMYENSAKRFIEISESEDFKYLANKHIDNAIEEHIEK